MKIVLLSLVIASFFSLLGRESRIGPRVWWLLSFGAFWIAALLGGAVGLPGVVVAIAVEVLLFAVVTVIWVITPRRTTAELYQRMERGRNERQERQLMQRDGGR